MCKHLEDIGEDLQDLGLDEVFLDMAPKKHNAYKEKNNNKLGFCKNFCSAKYPVEGTHRQVSSATKTFVDYLFTIAKGNSTSTLLLAV